MTGVFNKQDFEKKLHYTMLLMLSAYNGLCEFNDAKDVTETTNFFWSKALQTLWQTRLEGVMMIGIDNQNEFESFCAIINIGINQMNSNIDAIIESNAPAINRLSRTQIQMKEMAASLADDIANLLNHKQNEAA